MYKKTNSSQSDAPQLLVEQLEARMMLSSVEVFAAGNPFDLLVDGNVVASYDPAHNASPIYGFNGVTDRFVYETEDTLDASQIAIDFLGGPSRGRGEAARSLYVDKIIVDGETFEAEAKNTRYLSERLGINGFAQREALYASSGKFEFAQDNTGAPLGTRIRIDAIGQTGDENLQLQINGETVRNYRFDVADTTQSFFYVTDDIVDLSDVKIRFTNDLYEPDKGLDRNLTVSSFQTIDVASGVRSIAYPKFDIVTRTDQSNPSTQLSVFSSGVFTEADGIVDGFDRGDTLATFGFFQVQAKEQLRIRVDAFGDTGNEKLEVYFAGKLQGTFDVTQELDQYYLTVPNVGVQNGFDTGADPNSLVIKFANDEFDPATGFDNNLTVKKFLLINDAAGTRQTYRPLDDNVFATGVFVNDEITSGFGLDSTLFTEGYFQANPGTLARGYIG